MAKTTARANAADLTEFTADLTALFTKYNGRLYKIREANLIATIVPIAVSNILGLLALLALRR